jgi:hypothetical protein
MGVPSQLFTEIHKEKVNEMKRNLLDYVIFLRQQLDANNIDGQPADTQQEEISIRLTDLGYPVIPTTIQLRNLHKVDLTHILRTYLSAHYSKFK